MGQLDTSCSPTEASSEGRPQSGKKKGNTPLPIACQSCREDHHACDRQFPCGRCEKIGQKCIPVLQRPRSFGKHSSRPPSVKKGRKGFSSKSHRKRSSQNRAAKSSRKADASTDVDGVDSMETGSTTTTITTSSTTSKDRSNRHITSNGRSVHQVQLFAPRTSSSGSSVIHHHHHHHSMPGASEVHPATASDPRYGQPHHVSISKTDDATWDPMPSFRFRGAPTGPMSNRGKQLHLHRRRSSSSSTCSSLTTSSAMALSEAELPSPYPNPLDFSMLSISSSTTSNVYARAASSTPCTDTKLPTTELDPQPAASVSTGRASGSGLPYAGPFGFEAPDFVGDLDKDSAFLDALATICAPTASATTARPTPFAMPPLHPQPLAPPSYHLTYKAQVLTPKPGPYRSFQPPSPSALPSPVPSVPRPPTVPPAIVPMTSEDGAMGPPTSYPAALATDVHHHHHHHHHHHRICSPQVLELSRDFCTFLAEYQLGDICTEG